MRETHAVTPVFLQARQIPANTYKTVTDAWKGFHSALIVEEDRHLAEFITECGRYQYRVAPQGYKSSGDGYARRYDEIIADMDRKSKTTDDTVLWDESLEDHWWRTLYYLELVGRNGIILKAAIREGVQIFEPGHQTVLRTDYSKTGLGYFLTQQPCDCKERIPGCCSDGWKITKRLLRDNVGQTERLTRISSSQPC